MRHLSLMMGLIMISIAAPASFGAPSAPALEVQGHRGARAHRPENTLPAFEYAIQAGADVLETDMAVTKDKKIVLSHNPHLEPAICLDPSGQTIAKPPLIHSLTLEQVKQYDCGTLKNPKFADQIPVPGTRIPTLDELFDLVKKSKNPNARKIRFNIETKIFPDHPEYTVDPKEFVQLFLATVKKHKMMNRVILQSFDYRTLIEARKLEPKIVIAALSENPQENLVETARKLKTNISSPYWEMIDAKIVSDLHALGTQVIPWTPNTPEAWKKLIDMKVDGIITDDPDGLIRYLKENQVR